MDGRADQLTAFTSVESTTDSSIILHVDCDCFYAACERLRWPELHNEPVVCRATASFPFRMWFR